MTTAFEGVEWGEAYFGAWRERFQAEGAFPYVWLKAGRALYTEPHPAPSTINDAVTSLRVADMRRLLTDLGAMPDRGRPKKRAEFEELLAASGATDEVLAATRKQHEAVVEEHMAQREVAKCELLAHTLSRRTYALRDRRNRVGKVRGGKIRPMWTDCPVETAYASRFMAGKIAGAPPFFPGDRTSFVIDFDD